MSAAGSPRRPKAGDGASVRIVCRAREPAMVTGTRVASTVGIVLLISSVQSIGAEESRQDIPERYSRQVAPTPSKYWPTPDLRDYTRVLKTTEGPLIDPSKHYELPELIDLA